MIYYSNKKNENIKKYITNIQQNNKNFSILHYVLEKKLQISLKYSTSNSDEIFDYTNFYSYHQLQIINKYFRYFDNIEQICHNLDKLLKNNRVAIEEKIGFAILSISVLYKKESTNIIFKLLQNKITVFPGMTRNPKPIYYYSNYQNYTKEIRKNSLSMPKYDANETRQLKHYLDDLNDRVSLLESNHHRFESVPKENMNYTNNMNNNNNDKELLNNINKILTKMNKLEKENKDKDSKIKELEDKVSKFEQNISNAMSYQIYSIGNKSQKSKKDINNISEINKKNNQEEVEIEINSYENSINKSKDNENKLRSKKDKKSPKYEFKQIESKDESKSYKKKKLNESYKDESSKRLKKTKLKNKNKSQSSLDKKSNNSTLKNEEEKNNSIHKLKNSNYKRNSSNSQEEENKNEISEEKKIKKKKKKIVNEEEKISDIEDNKIQKESLKSLSEENKNKEEKKEKSSNSSEENKNKSNKKISKKKAQIGDNGLPMVEREDLKNYVNSRIFFTREELQLIKNKVIENRNHSHAYFDLLYRASIDGDYEEKIISFCEGIYPQIILFYTEEGARFGVYIEKEKNTNFFGKVTYKEIPGTSFLFSLNCLKIYDVLEGKKATDDSERQLCFGQSFYYNNNESNWLICTPRIDFLNLDCKIGDRENSFGLIDTNKIVGNQEIYHLKDVEIFKVIVYTNDKDEEDDNNKKKKKEKN